MALKNPQGKVIKCACVITAYRRRSSLRELLGSLRRQHIPEGAQVDLIVNIDRSELSAEISHICDHLEWPRGEKKINIRGERTGLKYNVLGSLKEVFNYDFIVLLEDDLFLSQHAVQFAIDVYERSRLVHTISGAGLYSYGFDETSLRDFHPFTNGLEVFKAKVPCSWGFITWESAISDFLENPDRYSDLRGLPHNVVGWSGQSWKKLFFKYLIEKDAYLIYPEHSLSSIIPSRGSHQRRDSLYARPLSERRINLPATLTEEVIRYDEYLEILPESLKQVNPSLMEHDFVVNLRGQKPLSRGLKLVRSRRSKNDIRNFAAHLPCSEYLVAHGVQGEGISLTESAPSAFGDFHYWKDAVRLYFRRGWIRRIFRLPVSHILRNISLDKQP